MKKLLIALLVLCSFVSKGQITNFLTITDTTTNTTIGSGIISGYGIPYIYGSTAQTMKDTVPVIMLVTDTCNCYKGMTTTDFDLAFQREGFAYYLKGYAARINTYTCCDTKLPDVAAYYWSPVIEQYLDADKQPLKKGIIVWFSK